MNGRAPLISPGRAGPGWAARGAPVIYTNYNCDVLKVEIVVPGPESGTRWATHSSSQVQARAIQHNKLRPGNYVWDTFNMFRSDYE